MIETGRRLYIILTMFIIIYGVSLNSWPSYVTVGLWTLGFLIVELIHRGLDWRNAWKTK